MTSPALLNRSPRFLLRLLRVRDNRVSPSKAGPSCGAIWSSVADSVSSDWFSACGVGSRGVGREVADRFGQRVRRGRARDAG